MTVSIHNATTDLTLEWGPEWGGQSSVELALTWEQMSDGRWRVWDRGALRDTWSCKHTWRIPKERAAALYDMVHVATRGGGMWFLASDFEGIHPLGPLINTSPALQVLVSSSQDLSMIPVNQDWLVELTMVPSSHPIAQGSWLDYASPTGLDVFLSRASATPSPSPAWGVARTETSWAAQSASGDAFSASLRTILSDDEFRLALARLVDLRGGIINIPGDRMPWGSGVEPNDAGTHRARPKAFSWSRLAPDLWELSITAVQEPV
jgi:hypothetical protein